MANLAVYIKFFNDTDYELDLYDKGASHGYWDTEPPQKILAKSTSKQFEIKDHSGAASGSEGYIFYKTRDKSGLEVYIKSSFCDSWSANNNYVYYGTSHETTFAANFVVTIDDVPHKNYCPESGHPIYLFLTCGNLSRTKITDNF